MFNKNALMKKIFNLEDLSKIINNKKKTRKENSLVSWCV